MWQRVVVPRASLMLINDNVFTGAHTHTHAHTKARTLRHGVFRNAQFFLFILRSCPVFLPIVNITFSFLNNILSIKCWQPNQCSLECF